jgi:hypothetical protein
VVEKGVHLLKEKEPEISPGSFFVLSLKICSWIVNSKAVHGSWGFWKISLSGRTLQYLVQSLVRAFAYGKREPKADCDTNRLPVPQIQELARDSEAAALPVLQASERRDPEVRGGFQGVCPNCGASGPKKEGRAGALRVWNGQRKVVA